MILEAINDYRTTMKHLTGTLLSFTEEQFNQAPFEGSWTPGQVAEHIVLYQQGIAQLFSGKVRPANRPANARQQEIADMFLNFEAKYDSPEFILPSNKPKAQESTVVELQQIMHKTIKAAQQYDPAEECLDLELPGSEPLTRLEWMYFLIYHTQRHIHQLQNIHNALAA